MEVEGIERQGWVWVIGKRLISQTQSSGTEIEITSPSSNLEFSDISLVSHVRGQRLGVGYVGRQKVPRCPGHKPRGEDVN